MSYILRSTKFVRYCFGLARSIVISNRQGIDGNILQRSHNLATLFSNNFSSSHFLLRQSSILEQNVRQLDEDARRTGRVTISEIEEALNNIRDSRQATASQSLMVIRCCGNLVPEETPEQRTKLVEEIWKTFQNLGVPLDISHYNALLKVYLENEHRFSPTEFLARLEANGIEPNRVTYQRLIAGFCQQGDIAGATKILEFMKDKQLPVSEGVFNALILGHSKANDMESAESILNVMNQANLEPSNETYTTLLSGYASRGDAESVQRLLTDCKLKDILLSDRDYLEIAYAAATNGHEQLVDEMMKNIRRSLGYNQDAVNIIIRLVTAGKDEAAYKVFLSLNPNLRSEASPNMSGHIFIKQLVKCHRPVDQIVSWCDRIQQDGHTTLGLWIAVDTSFSHHNTSLTLDLLRVLRQKQEPVRTHYFWPPLATAGRAKDFNRALEILKVMSNEFDLTVNTETLKDYFLPHVPTSKSINEVLTSLDSVGVKRGQAVVAMVNHLLNKKKVNEAVQLVHQHPNFNYGNYLSVNQLMDVLQDTNDVVSVVDLLHVLSQNSSQTVTKEEQDVEENTASQDDLIHRFFIKLLSSNSTRKYLPDILKEMVEHSLPISNTSAIMIENKLQENELTPEISELLTTLSSGSIIPQPVKRVAGGTTFVRTPESLKNLKERMKANNEPEEKIIGINRSLYQMYCHAGDVVNALKIKQELNEEYKRETTPGMWAGLLDAYCLNNDLEGAKSCLKNLESASKEFELDPEKLLKLAKLYIENNQLDEATALLTSVKARERETEGFMIRNTAWQLLQATLDTYKDPAVVKQMLKLLTEQKFIEVSNAMLGPIIKAYLLRDDVPGAMKEFEECVKLYRATPFKNELTIRFIEKEDSTNLQNVVDLSTEVHGEVNSLYDLVLAFIECGKIRQARKVLETPGLTSRNNRLMFACERYKKEGKTEFLEGLVEATKDVAAIDRSEIYNNLLDTYCQADEVEKALGLWTKMQDEDVQVSEEFLMKLGNFLKEKGHNVPFKIPEQQTSGPIEMTAGANARRRRERKEFTSPSPFMVAIRGKDADLAMKIKDELESSGKTLTRNEVNALLELLVEQSRLREAVTLVTCLRPEQRLLVRTLNFLLTRLSSKGETDLIRRVGEHITEELKKISSFSNRLMAAAVVSGIAKEELDKIEKEIDAASSNDTIDEVTTKFPRGGILSVLDNCPSDYEQVLRIADKFYSKGSTGPGNCVAMHFLARGDTEKAKEFFEKYNLKNSSQIMFRNVLSKARINKEPKLLEDLIDLLKDTPSATPEVMGLVYSNLINVYSDQTNFDTALQKLEEGLKTIPLEMFYNTTLVRLKEGLEASNKTFKYTIPPPRKQKDSSSSSSSSETEPKKSAASN